MPQDRKQTNDDKADRRSMMYILGADDIVPEISTSV